MDQHALNSEQIRAAIEGARDRRDAAYATYEAACREITWLQSGLRLYGLGEDEAEGDEMLRQVLPGEFPPARPTLRQAIVLVMRAGPRSDWSVSDIVDALAMNGWTPARAGESTKRVSDMAGVMANEGHLSRTGRGVYRLSTLLADALMRALPPITDYRIAAAHGLSVPDHPAASGGLAEE